MGNKYVARLATAKPHMQKRQIKSLPSALVVLHHEHLPPFNQISVGFGPRMFAAESQRSGYVASVPTFVPGRSNRAQEEGSAESGRELLFCVALWGWAGNIIDWRRGKSVRYMTKSLLPRRTKSEISGSAAQSTTSAQCPRIRYLRYSYACQANTCGPHQNISGRNNFVRLQIDIS